jgi:hypothetical protein
MTSLSDLQIGDRITVSKRSQPLTVTDVRPTDSDKGVIVEATTDATEYDLLRYEWDPKPVLRQGDARNVVGPVDVERVGSA